MVRIRSLILPGLVAALSVTLAACDIFGSGDSAVTVAFRVARDAPAGAPAQAAAQGPLVIEGTNGQLIIEDVWFIVDEFELERRDEACDELSPNDDDDDDCEEFETPPHFLQLLLDEERGGVVSEMVPPGVYVGFEFEVEDLELDDDDEFDDDDADEREQALALIAEVREMFDDWPDQASMLVVGRFVDADGAERDFRVFFEAEIEVELDFVDPLIVEEGGDETIMVVIDPRHWFLGSDQTVLDLSQFNGQLVEFEAEFEDGVIDIEFHD